MRLTTRGRFAVIAMLDIAIHQKRNKSISLAAISAREGISQSYLEQLFAKIRKHHLVNSARGPGGGYSLTFPANKISIASIINAVDDELDATQCGGNGNCKNNKLCTTHDLWAKLNDVLSKFLHSVFLSDLVEQYHYIQRGEGIIEKLMVDKSKSYPKLTKQNVVAKVYSHI